MMNPLFKIACAAVAGTVVTIAYAGAAQAFSLRVTAGVAGPGGVTNQGAYSDLYGTPSSETIDFNNLNLKDSQGRTLTGAARPLPSTALATYSFESYAPTNGVTGVKVNEPNKEWAPTSLTGERNTSKYLQVFNGEKVNINLTKKADYFGLNWGAISNNNKISFYRGTTLLKSYTNTDVIGLAPVTAVGHQGGQKNAYVDFYAAKDEAFDRIVLEQMAPNGTAFESDNHTFRKAPEPAAMLGLAVVSGAAWLKRKRANKA